VRIHRATAALALASASILAPATGPASAQPSSDPFAPLESTRGSPVLVPPRALAVIPERHTGRALRMIDTLERIVPQFDELARGAGLSPRRAIQLRTREANIPIFVAKTEASVSTLLQLDLGSRVEVRGVLIERDGRYLFLASEVRPSSSRRHR
jgi:hypothetical protein